jgi:hypothetical protein
VCSVVFGATTAAAASLLLLLLFFFRFLSFWLPEHAYQHSYACSFLFFAAMVAAALMLLPLLFFLFLFALGTQNTRMNVRTRVLPFFLNNHGSGSFNAAAGFFSFFFSCF